MKDAVKKLFRGREKRIALALAVFCGNFFLDRLTKTIAVAALKGRPPLTLLNGMAVFTYTENSGAFLSLGALWNIHVKYLVLLVIPVLICVLVLVYMMFREQYRRRIITACSIVGGGLGNLADRLGNEFKVIDFMNFGVGGVRTGILNTADLSVTFGVAALLIIEIVIHYSEHRRDRSP